MAAAHSVELVELRVLDGPNLYFPRPAIKLTLAVPGWLHASEERVNRLAARMGLPPRGRRAPYLGAPRSGERHRAVARLAAHTTRLIAEAAGVRPAVRARRGAGEEEIVVAFPWRRRGVAEALGREVAVVFRGFLGRGSVDRMIQRAVSRIKGANPGDAPSVPSPDIPVIAVTGTNGKTTTVRLLAHLLRTAGLSVAYTSTDGVYLNDELVEAGDYSGFGGAGLALSQPGVQAVVLETARGGILLRGIGTAHNDAAVVTNVSADHLGLYGIETLDQLAEVKATITRITRPSGWDVLNGDDPRVLSMRRQATGRPFLFSMDPDHPAIRTAIAEGGRAMTSLDGRLVIVGRGMRPRPLLPLEEVPVSLAGISAPNIQNAMAAAAAGLGVGLSEETVARGLRSFIPDPDRNPGRANLYELEGRIVVVDYAHNEAGMVSLMEICRGLCAPDAEIWVTFCAAGDRSPEIMHGLGYVAARAAHHVAVAELRHYLRGAKPEDVIGRLRAGAADGGASTVPVHPDEVRALEWMLGASKSDDVVAIAALSQRSEIFAMLSQRGARPVAPGRVRQLARRARSAARASA
jgi:cyanophycin synthetase